MSSLLGERALAKGFVRLAHPTKRSSRQLIGTDQDPKITELSTLARIIETGRNKLGIKTEYEEAEHRSLQGKKFVLFDYFFYGYTPVPGRQWMSRPGPISTMLRVALASS